MSRSRRWQFPIAAVAGIALFGYSVVSVGPRELLAQMRSLAPVLPVILVLAAVRFLLQAAGWRAAMPAAQRPRWRDVFAAVVAGEAAGYFAWGPVRVCQTMLSRSCFKAIPVLISLGRARASGAAAIAVIRADQRP